MLQKAKAAFVFILLCCGSGIPDLQAQQTRPVTLLKLSPQHFAINGMHLEVERQLSAASPNTVIVSPRFYYGNVSNVLTNRFYGDGQDQLVGGGLEVGYRIYANKQDNKPQGFYSCFATNYHRFQFKYPGLETYKYIGNDGLEYYGTRPGHLKENVNRYGGSVTMGYQFMLLQDKFVVDLYTGGGVKLSDSDTKEERSRYSMGTYDYASSKTYLIFGFKLGLNIN